MAGKVSIFHREAISAVKFGLGAAGLARAIAGLYSAAKLKCLRVESPLGYGKKGDAAEQVAGLGPRGLLEIGSEGSGETPKLARETRALPGSSESHSAPSLFIGIPSCRSNEQRFPASPHAIA